MLLAFQAPAAAVDSGSGSAAAVDSGSGSAAPAGDAPAADVPAKAGEKLLGLSTK